ncbi:hypothetical protein [Microbulbifer epialgicus]|uniref:Tetratricopeptide repeat-containing protein n=1 Tax=Microbulbifer epialgicus TaxID=393907 RepID=A0ABV4NVM4_9GAMM
MQYRPLSRALSLTLTLLSVSLPAFGNEVEIAQHENPAEEEEKAGTQKYRQAQDMAYGATLYAYFQGNNFDALSTLLIAKQRDSIKVHGDSAALIEGGISLSFGLHQRAAELFEQLLQADNKNIDTKYRQAAWLKLAELNYLQGDFPKAAVHLEKSGAVQTSSLPLNLALHSQDLSNARQLLENAELSLAQRLLGHINLGAALARSGQLDEAAEAYRTAGALAAEQDEPSEEIQVLADKAHIGAGYALALTEQFTQAQLAFSRVRLQTPWATKALLGLAWSSINNAEYQKGVDALHFLLSKHEHSPAAREARVALPYAYEKQQERNAALTAYSNAASYYQTTLQELQQLQQNLASEPLADARQFGEAQRYGWLQMAQASPLLRDNQHFLLPILQSDKFQLRLSELRDLQQINSVLQGWSDKLPQLHALIDERHQRRSNIIEKYQNAQFDQQLQIGRQQYRRLNDALAQIETERDVLALVKASSRSDSDNISNAAEMLELLRGAEQRYQLLQKHGKGSDYQGETLQRARGILLWQASEEYHHRLWQQRKTLGQLEENLRTGEKQLRKTSIEASRAPQLTELTERLQNTAAQLDDKRAAIAHAATLVEASLRQDIIAELDREQIQINGYLAHTRLAIARLQDASLQESILQPVTDNPQGVNQEETQPLENAIAEEQYSEEAAEVNKPSESTVISSEGDESE